MKRFASLLALVGAAALLTDPGDAAACGGCFVPQAERTVVTDHRMALSISPQQTVLWDQIRYSGDPREFAWVLPVRAGAKLEVSNDEWFSALDGSTQPVVYQPNNFGGAAGCALTGCADQSAASSDGLGPGQVQILSQSVVGPYETVTLRSTDPDALTSWLRKNAFAIPPSIEPTIGAYVDEGFDFIALRLRPDCGERAMRPVRVVTKGADPTLPLRMVAAGVGPRVGITLWVISEGRYRPMNFPSAEIDDDRLRWDRFDGRSNYDALSQELMGASGGRTWLTEYADTPQLFFSGDPRSGSRSSSGPTPGLADAYYGQCRAVGTARPSPSSSSSGSPTAPFTPCPRPTAVAEQQPTTSDAGEVDAGDLDAGADADARDTDAGDTDAGPIDDEAGAPDAGEEEDAGRPRSGETYGDAGDSSPRDPYAPSYPECAYLDDLSVALRGLHPQDVWVTRLRAVLPADALQVGDLRLEPARPQARVSNVHWAPYYTDEERPAARESCISAPKQHSAFGSWVLAACSAIGLVAVLRRRRR